MELETVALSMEGAVAVVTLNQPNTLNAISVDMLVDLGAVLAAAVDKNRGVRALVMTGAGRGFCAGANLIGRADAKPGQASTALETHYHPILRRLRDLPFPLISAVNGPAAGAGMSLALMGDLVLCAQSAYFLQAFRRIGLTPDCGSTWILPRLIGKARAMELSLLGEKLSAEKALAWGLVNRVVADADLMAAALALAQQLADGPTMALSLTRKLYWESCERSFEQQLDLEFQSQKQCLASQDFLEGAQAFLQKRPARFKAYSEKVADFFDRPIGSA